MTFMDGLFDNIGSKLKLAAKIVALIEIICMVICLFGSFNVGNTMLAYNFPAIKALAPISVLLSGALSVMLTAFPLYGFGQLVDDVHQMKRQTQGDTVVADELPDL